MSKMEAVNMKLDADDTDERRVNPLKLEVFPEHFTASVKEKTDPKTGKVIGRSYKTIGMYYLKVTLDSRTAERHGFPPGTVVVANAYLPSGVATKAQKAEAEANWKARKNSKGGSNEVVMGLDD